MALTVTERVENVTATTFGTGAATTASFTPTANSLILLAVFGLSNNNGPVTGVEVTNSGGLNFIQASEGVCIQENGTTWNVFVQWFYAEQGGSPASMTITIDGRKTNLSDTTMWNWGWWVADVTGYNTSCPIGTQGISASRTNPNALSYNLLQAPDTAGGVFAAYGHMVASNAMVVDPGSGWTEAWENAGTDHGFHVQYDITSPDQSVEYVDVSNGTGTYIGYCAAAIEVIDASVTAPTTHHPKIGRWNLTVSTSTAATTACNMPAGIEAGDLLLAFVASDNSNETPDGSWTEIFDTANGTAVRGFIFGLIAAGGDTLTLTNGTTGLHLAVLIVDIKQHGVSSVGSITQGTPATGNTANPDPPNCSPGSADEWLYLQGFFADDDDNQGGWLPGTLGVWDAEGVMQVESGSATTSVMLGLSSATRVSTSFNQGAFVMAAAEEWITYSMAIPPEVFGGGPAPQPDPYKLRRNRPMSLSGRR